MKRKTWGTEVSNRVLKTYVPKICDRRDDSQWNQWGKLGWSIWYTWARRDRHIGWWWRDEKKCLERPKPYSFKRHTMGKHKSTFYIHGSVHRESNLITVQQDATVFSLLHFCMQLYMFRVLTPIIRSLYSCNYSFSLLHFCMQLYMFRVLTPIIRSWYSCNYSFWYWLTGSSTIHSRCWVGTDSCLSYGTYSYHTIR